MVKFLHLTKKRPMTRKNRCQSKARGINFKTVNCFIGVLLIVMCVAYVMQMNNLSTKGYKFKELEQALTELKLSAKSLESQALELQTVKRVTERINTLNMISSQKVEFLASKDKEVAVAR